MLKAVIDTSVFISGLVKSPVCRKIIKAIEGSEFILVTSPEILAELIGVIARPKFHQTIKRETAARLVETIKSQALLVKPPFSLDVIKDDSDDNCFLEAALTSKSDCIVSLDNHLLSLRIFHNIQIVTPTKFINLLGKSK